MPLHDTQEMPDIDEMLQSLLLIEEGEHELSADDAHPGELHELRHLFFPVTRHCIYLNHAITGPLPRPVAHILQEYVSDLSDFGSINAARWRVHQQGAHRRLAALLNARPEQFALTNSVSDGLMHIALGLDWQTGDEIVMAEGEFAGNPWLNLQAYDVSVRHVPTREHRILAEDVLASISARTRLVMLSLVELSTGYRNDIATIARHCHERGVLCGVDATQAVGAIAVDIASLGVDFLAGHGDTWLLGASTSGFLYSADSLLERLKTGTARFAPGAGAPNVLCAVGLDAALGIFESIDGGMAAVETRILGLTEHALHGLQRLGYPVISPHATGERSGILCFTTHPARPDLNAQQLAEQLAARNIHVCARGSTVCISPHFYNVTEELDTLLNALEEMAHPVH